MQPDRRTNMKWWPVFGLTKRLTERKRYSTELPIEPVEKIFRKSLHLYPIDVGNANDLNFDIRAMQAPQYNIHRFGIFFADVPRHADVLLVLGRPTEKMLPVLMETINQMPEPFSIVAVENEGAVGMDIKSLHLGNVVAHITDYKEPEDLVAVLLKVMGKTN
jgi:Ni,Fe-hydrogenase III small subunit